MQNIPRDEAIRSVFVAAPGQQLVVADYSQLELRVMAQIANDPVMTDACRKGMDLHAVTAAAMLGMKPDEFDPERVMPASSMRVTRTFVRRPRRSILR